MTKIRTRAALAAIPLALGALAIGAGSASANSGQWGDNGSGTCSAAYSSWAAAGAGGSNVGSPELGTYCMQSVTGWIQINGGASQQQAISCSNNDSSSGLSWSVDGQAYVNAGPWYALASDVGMVDETGYQTGDGGDATLSSEAWFGGYAQGNTTTGSYGGAGEGVTNWGGNGNWQAAIACVNAAGASASGEAATETERTSHAMERLAFASTQVANTGPVRTRDKTIDTVDKKHGKAFLAREYPLRKNVTRTDTRTCPTGMVRTGKLTYTIQEFPADHASPKWKDRSLVKVTMTPKGKNAAQVSMTLTKVKNPTVVQFQLRCAKA
jgi:hypothetical protein